MKPQAFLVLLMGTLSLFTTTVGHPSGGHSALAPRSNNPQENDNNNNNGPPPSRHGKLTFTQTVNVTRVLINNPPINLLTIELISDLYDFLLWTQPSAGKTTPKVVIFSSALPDFFISHFDLQNLQSSNPASTAALPQLVACGRLLQNITSTAFIAEVNGRTFGGGQELSSQMDMRFAGPNALVSQYENSCGFIAVAGGQLSLGPIIGKARAMEHLLASKTIDAKTGTDIGLFNAHYGDSRTLRREVDALAARIGLFPQSALNDTKFSLSFLSPSPQQLDAQIARFAPVAASDASQATIKELLRESDQGANSFEKGIPNSVVQNLYTEQVGAMGDEGRKVLDAAKMDL
ncbi:MAG: hypothetical protein Q9201_005057 [Fulgogasparrea decipioides]